MSCRTLVLLVVASVSNLHFIGGEPSSEVSMSECSESSSFNVQTQSHTVDGQHVNTVSITGNGVCEKMKFSSPSSMGLSVNTFDKCLIIRDLKRDDFLIFSDEPGTLVIMRDGICTKKTYKSTGGGISSTSKHLSDADCRAVQKKASEQLEKNRVQLDKWNKTFEKDMKETFYPGFPFGNKQDKNDFAGSNSGSSMFSGSVFKGVSDFMSKPQNLFFGFGKKNSNK